MYQDTGSRASTLAYQGEGGHPLRAGVASFSPGRWQAVRRTGVLLLIMVVLLFAGCAHDPSDAYYGLFEDEAALIAFETGDTLFLVILPWSVVENQADGSGNTPSRLLMELG